MMNASKARMKCHLLLHKRTRTGCFKKINGPQIDVLIVYVQVKNVHCKPGETVGEGDLLVELE